MKVSVKLAAVLIGVFAMISGAEAGGGSIAWHLLETAYDEIRVDSMLSVDQDSLGKRTPSPRLCDGRSYLDSMKSSMKRIDDALDLLGEREMLSGKRGRLTENLLAMTKSLRRIENYCAHSMDYDDIYRVPNAADVVKAAQQLKALSLEGLKIVYENEGQLGGSEKINDENIEDARPLKVVGGQALELAHEILQMKQVAK